MRIALALASCLVAGSLAGCLIQDSQPNDGYYNDSGWGSGYGGGGGPVVSGCASDAACGTGLVCARTGECLAPSQVRIVHTTWTVKGAAASDATCARAPNLSITFLAPGGDEFGYTPVPCRAGKHTVDKFPSRYTTVSLSREYEYSGGPTGTFDAQGNALLDLQY